MTARLAALRPPWSVNTLAQEAGLAALADGDFGERTLALVAAMLQERLLPKQLLIRNCAGFVGLNDRFFRIAVRTQQENERLLAALAGECVP